MTGLSLVVALQLSAVTAASQPAARPYLEAYQRSVQSGRPFVVLLEADWCTACQVMKRTTLPQVARAGGLQRIELAYVNVDQHQKLAAQLVRGKSIPQLIRFDRTSDGWKRSYLIGAKSPQQVYQFLAAGASSSPPGSKLAAGTTRTRGASQPPRKIEAVAKRTATWSNLPHVPQPPQVNGIPR
jgi:thioredoxin-like negative regulator of GroEL